MRGGLTTGELRQIIPTAAVYKISLGNGFAIQFWPTCADEFWPTPRPST
jgi:hypothetical protein